MAVEDTPVLRWRIQRRNGGSLAAVSGGLPMVERTTAPAGVAPTGQDVLLATKLYVPRPPPGLVARPRLAETLGEGLAGALILVSAPAGFGKTALLADWIRANVGRLGGCRWMRVTMTPHDFGVTLPRLWIGCAQVSVSGSTTCSARPRRILSRGR
jgi:hypothetical protein